MKSAQLKTTKRNLNTLSVFFFMVISLFLLSACGGAGPKSGDTTLPAIPTGLSASSGNQTIALNWNANTEEDLAGYILFWGTSAEQLDQQASIEKNKTSHSITDLENDSSYFFAIAAKDTSENTSQKSDMISATPGVPDSSQPTITLSSSDDAITSASSITLTADASDDVAISKVEFYEGVTKLSEVSAAPYSLELIFTAADNGDHSYTAKAFDTSGNEATSNIVNVNVNIQASGDTTAPNVSISSSQTTITSATSIKLSATASDNVGIAKVAFFEGSTKLGEDGSQPYELNLNLDSSDNGSHTYVARAFDAAGNEASDDIIVLVNISTADTTAPSVSLSSSASSISPSADYITLTANASDNVDVSKVEFYQNDGLIFTSVSAPYKKTVGLTVYNNGTNSFKAIAYDTSGNTKTSNIATVNVNVTKLYVNPVQGVTEPALPEQAFKTISKAATVAKNGMTIHLETGSYNAATGEVFPITFNDGVSVQGSPDGVSISGNGVGMGNGLIFAGSGELYGVDLKEFSKAVIAQGGTLELEIVQIVESKVGLELTNNTQVTGALLKIHENEFGVVLKNTSKLFMQKVSIYQNEVGFSVNQDSRIDLDSVLIYKHSKIGIVLGANAKASLKKVSFTDNTLALDLIVNNEVIVENTTIQNGQSGVRVRGSSKFTMTGGEISGMGPNCNAETYGISAGGTSVKLSGVNIHDNLGYALAVGFSTKAEVVNSTFLKNGASGNCNVPYANTVVSTLNNGELTLQNTILTVPNAGPNTVLVYNLNKMTITGGTVGEGAKTCIYSSATLTLNETTVAACETGIYIAEGTADFDDITVQNHTTSGIQFIQGSLKMLNSKIMNNGGAGIVVQDAGASLGQIAICCGGTTIPGNNRIFNNTFFGVNTVTDEPGESFIVVANGNIWNPNKQGTNAQGKYAASAVVDGPSGGLVGDNYHLVSNTKIIR